VGELPKDNPFLNIDQNLPEAAKYAFLFATKDMKRIHETKVFWVLMEVRIQMWINRRPWLSPTVYTTLESIAEFKEDMHNIYVWAQRDPTKEWTKLLFIATDDAVFMVLETWPP